MVTATLLLTAGRPRTCHPLRTEDEQTLEENALHYEDVSPVRIISLKDLEPADTNPEQVLMGEWAGLQTAEASEMAEILAELNLNDGTCIRLYATAEGLVYGAFCVPAASGPDSSSCTAERETSPPLCRISP